MTVAHRQPDRVPYVIGFTEPARRKLVEHWGTEDLDSRIANHVVMVEPSLPGGWRQVRPGYWQDEFGVLWNRTVDADIGNAEDFILQRMTLGDYAFPDPADPARYETLRRTVQSRQDRYLMAALGFSLFERAWTLRGMEQLLVDMIDSPRFVDELLDRICEHNLVLIDHACRFEIDAFHFGDDWGQQHGLIMGPVMWRRFIKPRLARMYARVKRYGKTISIHSCGDITLVIPDLIELGLDIFNPFQPEVMDVRRMKSRYGKDLCFWGGVSTQRTLPYGRPADVRAEVEGLMRDIGAGGGYILSPAHSIPKDVPVENILALIEAVQS